MIVEDDADLAAMLKLLLEAEGYAVETAVNGAALALAASIRPAAILLDIMMPGMDGIEVAQQLRADPRTHPIPIVLMSAAHRLRERAQEVQVDRLLPKPFDVGQVLGIVEQLTGAALPPTEDGEQPGA
jgi:CheY-like chemotaxis protein